MECTVNGTICTITKRKYGNGRLALTATDNSDGMPYATITTNLVHINIKPEEAFIDTNNLPNIEKELRSAGIIGEKPERYGSSGFCMYPLYKILV